MRRRVFTIEEANALIPHLEEAFRAIGYFKAKIRDNQRKLEVLGLLWEDSVAEPTNPDYKDFVAHKRAIENDISEIERVVQDEVVRRGLRFPVGALEHGLVDFPSTYQGRWVYLCWQNGEPELLYWHETNAGFRGRQRITDEHRRLMGRDGDPDTMDDSALDI